MRQTVPDGFTVRGVSTYYDSEGQVRGQWVKSRADDTRREQIIRDFVASLVEDVRGLAPAVTRPVAAKSQLLCTIPMGDPHFGMYAYAAETGDDFDLKIADRITRGAVDRLIDAAPEADTCIIENLGDFFHADDSKNRTPQSGHALDVDTRYALVVQVGLKALVYCINRAREKFPNVIYRGNPGNHDPHAALMLSLCLSAYFDGVEGVTIDLSPAAYWYCRGGKVLLGTCHGDGAKHGDLPLLMATDVPEDWGASKFRHWHVGHVHHWTGKEHPGCVVETFRTLAGRDAWHAGKGYRAGRDMHLIVYHKEFGEVERHRCDVTMLEAA